MSNTSQNANQAGNQSRNQDANQKAHIACIMGTRPEIIKLAPVIFELQKTSWAKVSIVNTAQHRELSDEFLKVFDLVADFDLNVMVKDQSLGELGGNLSKKLDTLLTKHPFQAVLAVGDTSSVFFSALAAFYHKIPFGHVEAGLRTFDRYQPFPEEINRRLCAPLATWSFAPTEEDKNNLLKENIDPSSITVTGNTVIDALFWVLTHKKASHLKTNSNRIITVTAHRRENHGKNLEHICKAILILSQQFKDVDFMISVHPNPNVQKVMFNLLNHQPHIHLFSPLNYVDFSHLEKRSYLMLTDSGGIQEEASALHKPVVILRNCTEREAIVKEGLGILVGTNTEDIVSAVSRLLTDENYYKKMTNGKCPYGDGYAANYIVERLGKDLSHFKKISKSNPKI